MSLPLTVHSLEVLDAANMDEQQASTCNLEDSVLSIDIATTKERPSEENQSHVALGVVRASDTPISSSSSPSGLKVRSTVLHRRKAALEVLKPPSTYAQSVHSLSSAHSGGSRASAGTTRSFRSVHSQSSRISKRSFTIISDWERRQGRRIFQSSANHRDPVQDVPCSEPEEPLATNQSAEPQFYCTFCWKSFRNSFTWSRHELEMHIGGGDI
jgi:hypothetical protein